MRWSCWGCAGKDRDRDVRIQGTHFGLVQKGWSSQTVKHIHLCLCTCNIANIIFDEWLEQLRTVYELILTILMMAKNPAIKAKEGSSCCPSTTIKNLALHFHHIKTCAAETAARRT